MIIKKFTDLDQWHLARWSKFTASENWKLLTANGASMFGAGAMTYIEDKVLQMSTHMWERPELEEVKSLLHGKMYEYPAYLAYVKAIGDPEMIYLGEENPLFLEYEAIPNESGGSPDVIRLTSDAKVEKGCEIKCPKNPKNHFNRLKWKTQWDLKEGYFSCYTQIQNLLLISGAQQWDFVSFDERMIRDDKKTKIIEVFPDKKFQDNLHLRIKSAVDLKYKIYEDYMNAA